MFWLSVESLFLLALLAKFFTIQEGLLVSGFVIGPTTHSFIHRDATILYGFRSFLRKGAQYVRPKSIVQDHSSSVLEEEENKDNSIYCNQDESISFTRRFGVAKEVNGKFQSDHTTNIDSSGRNSSQEFVPSTTAERPLEVDKKSPMMVEEQSNDSSVALEEKTEASTITTLLEKPKTHFLESPLYTLAPVNRTMNSLEKEFRAMLESFSNYSQRDLMSLRDENVRVLFEGVAASAHEPAVYRAFEVLFEDLYPLRIASRVIHKKLLKLMEDSKKERQNEVDAVVAATGLDPAEVEMTWLMFISAASKRNRGNYLTKEQLCSTGFLDDLKNELHPSPIESLMEKFDTAKNGQLGFTEFIIALQSCVSMECSLERQCDSLAVLQNLVHRINTHEDEDQEVVSDKKLQFGRRYDEMLEAFVDWKDLVPEGEGPVLDVVRGCFVGAENEKVVKALRICYVDYSGLRMAAEIIFKLVKSFITKRQKSMESKPRA